VHTHVDRRRTREGGLSGPAHDADAVDDLPAGGDVEQTLLRRQVIDRALASLPEDLRVLVVLRDVHGLKYDEIAKVVKTPRGTVESRLFRARQRLRPLLEPLIALKPIDEDPSEAADDIRPTIRPTDEHDP
jgi:RNA polymerase sigma factor (sigma-70 family)